MTVRGTVTITQESFALTCKNYNRWETFKEHLRVPLETSDSAVRAAILHKNWGLRYRDVIDRSTLGPHGCPLGATCYRNGSQGEFHSSIAPYIEGSAHQLVVQTAEWFWREWTISARTLHKRASNFVYIIGQ